MTQNTEKYRVILFGLIKHLDPGFPFRRLYVQFSLVLLTVMEITDQAGYFRLGYRPGLC